MNNSKMREVAKLFGKNLNEEFKIKYGSGHTYEAVVKFTENSFHVKRFPRQDYWTWDNDILEDLLTGKAVIVDE